MENIALHLIEDRPSSNITSPGSLPVDLAIPYLTITRDKTGLFSIQPTGKLSLSIFSRKYRSPEPIITLKYNLALKYYHPGNAGLSESSQQGQPKDSRSSIACASLPEVTGGPGNLNSKNHNAMSSMSHHLDLVRSGVASIETELQQRASLLAVDNANLRNILENSSSEVAALRAKAKELESTQQKLGLLHIAKWPDIALPPTFIIFLYLRV